jgi:hypothetical protein
MDRRSGEISLYVNDWGAWLAPLTPPRHNMCNGGVNRVNLQSDYAACCLIVSINVFILSIV